jgi:adhesin transport system outer membrane protein
MNSTSPQQAAISRSLILVLAIVMFPLSSNATELNDIVADAIQAHPEILEQVHVFRQADRDRDIAASGWRPSVDLQASAGKYETESPFTQNILREYNSNRAELSVTQNLFNGFDTRYQQAQTEARLRSSLFEIFDTADNIALDAVQAYVDVLRQQKLVELADKNVSNHERILSQIRERSESGVGRRSELQQTEGRVARAHASLIAQQNNLQDAESRLHEVLGRYVIVSKLQNPELPEHPGQSLDELIDIALEKHPAIKVASYNVKASMADSSRARSNNYPKLDLQLAKEVGSDISGLEGNLDELRLVLNLSYNLYRGGADRATQRKTISAVHQNQEFARKVQRQVINTLRLAWAADQSLTRQMDFLEAHIEKSRETVESYGEEFFIGQRDLIDLLNAENELNTAQNQHANAYFDAMAARYRILEGVGNLFPALNLDVSVGEDDLLISKIQAQGIDTLPLDPDRDKDKEMDKSDHCDNTKKNNPVNQFGCENETAMNFGYNQENLAPVVGDDQLNLEMNSVLLISQSMLLENDTDADNDLLRLVDFTQPGHGALAFDDRKNLVYRPEDGFVGTDSFTYSITDGHGAVATAKVKIVVTTSPDMKLTKTQYVNFLSGKTTLTSGSQAKIQKIISRISDMDYAEIEIFAYTDDVGSDDYNLELSKRRASSMRELLISHGLDKNSIKAFGMGEKNPIADNATAEGKAINRRGELRVKFGSRYADK